MPYTWFLLLEVGEVTLEASPTGNNYNNANLVQWKFTKRLQGPGEIYDLSHVNPLFTNFQNAIFVKIRYEQ